MWVGIMNRNLKMLSPKDVGKLLSINYEKVLELIHLGELEAVKIGRQFRIGDLQVFEYLEKNKYSPYWKGMKS